MEVDNMTKHRILVYGVASDFLEEMKLELAELNNNDIEYSPLDFFGNLVLDCDIIIINALYSYPAEITVRARELNIPLVFLSQSSDDVFNFSIEEPISFKAVETDPRAVAEFITLILLFNKKMKLLNHSQSLRERIDLLDDVINDFGKTLNNKLCTLIGYADYAISESSLHEMQKALEIALETGIDTAQLLQNMLISVKSVISDTQTQKQRWAA